MEDGICHVPISIGELYDKYTILQIKQERIEDGKKLAIINKELGYLTKHVDTLHY